MIDENRRQEKVRIIKRTMLKGKLIEMCMKIQAAFVKPKRKISDDENDEENGNYMLAL